LIWFDIFFFFNLDFEWFDLISFDLISDSNLDEPCKKAKDELSKGRYDDTLRI